MRGVKPQVVSSSLLSSWSAVSLSFLLVALVGCGGPSVVDAGSSAGGSGGGLNLTGGGPGTGGGGGSGTGGGTSTTGGGSGNTGGGGGGGPEFGNGDAGSPCTGNSDCGSGNCVAWFRDAGSVCGKACDDQTGCSDLTGFVCSPDRNGNGVCVPRSPAHCLPCNFDSDCGGTSEACVLAPGDTMMTCRIDCSLSADACPNDYTCTQVRFNNVMRSFCMPPANVCNTAQGGFCERYSQPQPCANGSDAGTCTGARTCVGGRYSTCNAQTPACKATCTTPDRPDCQEPLCPSATQVPAHCGDCNTSCAGAGAPGANVTCADGGCTFSCKGDNYDADGRPDSGCELADTPTTNHVASGAVNGGSVDCFDGSTITVSGVLPSDVRVHELPAVVAFDTAKGAAPDFIAVGTSGGTFCVNDIAITLTVTGAANPACYRLAITTDKGVYGCDTTASGTCTATSGSGSYSGGTTTSLVVSRTCAAAASGGSYRVTGHF